MMSFAPGSKTLAKLHIWSWYLVPLNAGSTGLSTIIPLDMLQLGATAGQVAMAVFLSGIASTVGALLWGKLMSTANLQVMVILVSAGSIVVTSIVMMLFISNFYGLLLISTLNAILTAGSGPVTNMLIMQRSHETERIKLFSWTSLISCVGLVIAMVVGYVWLNYYSTKSYSAICGLIGVAAVLLTLFFTRRSSSSSDCLLTHKENEAIASEKIKISSKSVELRKAIHQALVIMPSMQVHLTSIKKSFVMLQFPSSVASATTTTSSFQKLLSSKETLFFAGVGLYFLSGNLFFVPYTPFLKGSGISDSEVFLAYAILHLSKVIFLPFNNRIVMAIGGEQRAAKWSYVPRFSGILLTAMVALLLTAGSTTANSYGKNSSTLLLIVTVVAFVAIDVPFSIWNTTTTSFLMRTIPSGKEGRVLGVNNSIVGAGLLIGSITSAETIEVFGYGITFVISAIVFVSSLILVKISFNKHKPALKV